MAQQPSGNRRLQWPDRFGALVWLAGVALFFALHLYAEAAWKNPGYSWAANNISDLGNVYCQPWGDDRRFVCSPRHDAMNAGFVIQGAAMLIGLAAVSLRRAGSARTWTAGALLLAAGAGWILAGVWPADVNENRHCRGGALLHRQRSRIGPRRHGAGRRLPDAGLDADIRPRDIARAPGTLKKHRKTCISALFQSRKIVYSE
jgi:hypothetical protein